MIALVHTRRVRARLDMAASGSAERFVALGRVCARLPWFAGRDAAELGRQAACAIAGAAVFAVSARGMRSLAAIPLGVLGGWRAPAYLDARGARAAALEVQRALPEALDRLATCVLAGMSVERALRVVTPGTPGRLGEAFAHGLRALDVGVPRSRAYDLIAGRAGADDVRAVCAALARAERFGTSVSQTLVAQARELRQKARAIAEAEARAAPVKLIFPLVFCFLPAFVLLTVAPIAISAIRTLAGT